MERLDPRMVLGAYAVGVFPMADHRTADGVYWVEPKRRAIMPLDGFHLSRSLKKAIISNRFRVTADTAFEQVIALCAQSANDRPETWISGQIESVFTELHQRGYAHSVECWVGDRLAGGLYGLALGRAFFGESMVSRERDASKVALAWLVARLRQGGFTLLDCQFQTDHLASLGAIEISRADYLGRLSAAVDGVVAGALGAAGGAAGGASAASPSSASPPSSDAAGDFFALDTVGRSAIDTVAAPPDGKLIAQLLGHTS